MKSALLLNQAQSHWPITKVVPPYVPDDTQRQNKVTFVVTHNQEIVRKNLQLYVAGALAPLTDISFSDGTTQLSALYHMRNMYPSIDNIYGYDIRIGKMLAQHTNKEISELSCRRIQMNATLRLFDNSTSTELYIDYNQENELTYPKARAYCSSYKGYEELVYDIDASTSELSMVMQKGPYDFTKDWWITIYIDIPKLTYTQPEIDIPIDPEPEPTPDPDAPSDLDHN